MSKQKTYEKRIFIRDKTDVLKDAPASKERELSPEEAKRMILLILRDGNVKPTYHCRKDSSPKRHVSMQDVAHVLRYGEIIRKPEWCDKHQNWKYRVEGVDLDDDALTAITVIIERNLTLDIITVF